MEEKELEREENLYKKLPLLIREIILSSALPLPTDKEYVEKEIKEIKKITNAECKSALEYLEKNNIAFRKKEITIDGTKVGEQIVPSMIKTLGEENV